MDVYSGAVQVHLSPRDWANAETPFSWDIFADDGAAFFRIRGE